MDKIYVATAYFLLYCLPLGGDWRLSPHRKLTNISDSPQTADIKKYCARVSSMEVSLTTQGCLSGTGRRDTNL